MIRAGALRITAGPDAAIDAAWLNTKLVEAGVGVHELRRERASLESVFLDLTGTGPEHQIGRTLAKNGSQRRPVAANPADRVGTTRVACRARSSIRQQEMTHAA